MCRRESEQRADRGAIDPHARAPLDAELFSTPGEQPVQGVDAGDDRAAFDPSDRRLRDPGAGRERPLREPRPPPRIAEEPGCVHESMITKKVSTVGEASGQGIVPRLFQIVELGSDIWNRVELAAPPNGLLRSRTRR